MAKNKNLPVFVGSNELIQDLNDLGYRSIEIDDLLDLLEDEEDIYEHIYLYFTLLYDEINFLPPHVSKMMYEMMDTRRSTQT